jgi:hypothetical protein
LSVGTRQWQNQSHKAHWSSLYPSEVFYVPFFVLLLFFIVNNKWFFHFIFCKFSYEQNYKIFKGIPRERFGSKTQLLHKFYGYKSMIKTYPSSLYSTVTSNHGIAWFTNVKNDCSNSYSRHLYSFRIIYILFYQSFNVLLLLLQLLQAGSLRNMESKFN